MLADIHKGQLAMNEVLDELTKVAARLPSLEQDLATLLEASRTAYDNPLMVTFSVGNGPNPPTLHTQMPLVRLIDAKRDEIGRVMQEMSRCQEEMGNAFQRLMSFNPLRDMPATEAMVGSGRQY
jgi:hypothetical protein